MGHQPPPKPCERTVLVILALAACSSNDHRGDVFSSVCTLIESLGDDWGLRSVTRKLLRCGPGRGPAGWIIPGQHELSEQRAVLSVQLARLLIGSVLMVRRRSTVRFRNGAPSSEAGPDLGTGPFGSWCSSKVQQRGSLAEPLPEFHEGVAGGGRGDLCVDLHRQGDLAVPQDLHRDARVHVEGG